MISQELMLGDWVMLNPDLKEYYPFAGKSCMVIGLHDDDGAIKIEYDNGKYFWTDAEDDVIPIPLTPEILENNGFTDWADHSRTTRSCSMLIDRTNIIVQKIDGTDYIFTQFYRGGVDSCEFRMDLKYVHELQHALRLCGIDKEIEL